MINTSIDSNLIYDIGAHSGEDTKYYLSKGFRVVAFEANPQLIGVLNTRFEKEILSGRLTVVEGAIADLEGDAETEFYVSENSFMGTINYKWASENQRKGIGFKKIRVRVVNFEGVLSSYGIPYYAKIDIEGSDNICLSHFATLPIKPRFLSFEADRLSLENFCKVVRMLESAGYASFLPVQQASTHLNKNLFPPKEGLYTDHVFTPGETGPFGNELPNRWIEAGEVIEWYLRHLTYKRKLKHLFKLKKYMVFKKLIVKPLQRHGIGFPGWFDIHVRHTSYLEE